MGRSSKVAAGLAMVSLALGLAGCGGGDDDSSSLTKAEFVKQGNAICAAGNKKTDAAFSKMTKGMPIAQAEKIVEGSFVPAVQDQITAIRGLNAPEGDQATISHMLDLAQEDLEDVEAKPGSILHGGQDPFADFAKIAHPYGLTECDKA